MSLTCIKVLGTFKAELCLALKSPGLIRRDRKTFQMFWQDSVWPFQGTGRRAQSSRSVCGQEEKLTPPKGDQLLAGSEVATILVLFLGPNLSEQKMEGISLKPTQLYHLFYVVNPMHCSKLCFWITPSLLLGMNVSTTEVCQFGYVHLWFEVCLVWLCVF